MFIHRNRRQSWSVSGSVHPGRLRQLTYCPVTISFSPSKLRPLSETCFLRSKKPQKVPSHAFLKATQQKTRYDAGRTYTVSFLDSLSGAVSVFLHYLCFYLPIRFSSIPPILAPSPPRRRPRLSLVGCGAREARGPCSKLIGQKWGRARV